MKLSRSEEDFILELWRIGKPARVIELADNLSIKAPSVTSMTNKLLKKGLVNRKLYQPLELTSEGRRVAEKLIHRHRLLETFLCEFLDYSWDEVHEEADELEHVVSDKFVEQLRRKLDYPEHNPHGQPIFHSDDPIENRKKLSDLSIGVKSVIKEVADSDTDLLRFLGRHNLYPGTEIQVIEVEKSVGLISICTDNRTVTIGLDAAKSIYVIQK